MASVGIDDRWLHRVDAVGSAAVRGAHLNVRHLWRRVEAHRDAAEVEGN